MINHILECRRLPREFPSCCWCEPLKMLSIIPPTGHIVIIPYVVASIDKYVSGGVLQPSTKYTSLNGANGAKSYRTWPSATSLYLRRLNPLSKLSPVSLHTSAVLKSCLAAVHKIELDNKTAQEDATKGFALEALIEEYHVALVIICLGSLILGCPIVVEYVVASQGKSLGYKTFISFQNMYTLPDVWFHILVKIIDYFDIFIHFF